MTATIRPLHETPPPAAQRAQIIPPRVKQLQEALLATGYSAGHTAGERQGFTSGTRWGMVVGMMWGTACGALLVMLAVHIGLVALA